MMFGRSDWRGGLSPAQFNLRVAILGAFALVIFSAIFFRLWYLEVLSGDRYLAEANNNQVREVTVQAPRGEIVDRNGKMLVGQPHGACAAGAHHRAARSPKRGAGRR